MKLEPSTPPIIITALLMPFSYPNPVQNQPLFPYKKPSMGLLQPVSQALSFSLPHPAPATQITALFVPLHMTSPLMVQKPSILQLPLPGTATLP